MANLFKNARLVPTTTPATLYTAPAATQSIIHALYVANIDGALASTVTIETIESGPTYKMIANAVPVPAKNTLVFPKPINLDATKGIRVTAGHNSRLEVFASILEITAGDSPTTNTFKNVSVTLGTSMTTIYTCPAATTAIIHAAYYSNYIGSEIAVSSDVYDSTGAVYTKLNYLVPVPSGETMVLSKPINLEANDVLRAQSNTLTSCQLTLSVLEIS